MNYKTDSDIVVAEHIPTLITKMNKLFSCSSALDEFAKRWSKWNSAPKNTPVVMSDFFNWYFFELPVAVPFTVITDESVALFVKVIESHSRSDELKPFAPYLLRCNELEDTHLGRILADRYDEGLVPNPLIEVPKTLDNHLGCMNKLQEMYNERAHYIERFNNPDDPLSLIMDLYSHRHVIECGIRQLDHSLAVRADTLFKMGNPINERQEHENFIQFVFRMVGLNFHKWRWNEDKFKSLIYTNEYLNESVLFHYVNRKTLDHIFLGNEGSYILKNDCRQTHLDLLNRNILL